MSREFKHAQSAEKQYTASAYAKQKEAVREAVLNEITPAHVFDLYAGPGGMYRSVWHRADSYVGCDKEWFRESDHLAFVGDNRRVLRCLDLQQFNVFDCDGYANPWEQVIIIAKRRAVAPGEKIAIVITESGMKLKASVTPLPGSGNSLPRFLAALAGISPYTCGTHTMQIELYHLAMKKAAALMDSRPLRFIQWTRGTGSAAMVYMAMIAEGVTPPSS